MIIRPRPSFLKLFFVMRGSVVPRILPQIVGFAAYAAAIVAAVHASGLSLRDFNIAPFGLIVVTLSIYLGFRNNAAYDRWWEARKLWGSSSTRSATSRAPAAGSSPTPRNGVRC